MHNFLVVWWIVTWHAHHAPPPPVDPYVGTVQGSISQPSPYTSAGMWYGSDPIQYTTQYDSETELFSKHFEKKQDALLFVYQAPENLKGHILVIDEKTGDRVNVYEEPRKQQKAPAKTESNKEDKGRPRVVDTASPVGLFSPDVEGQGQWHPIVGGSKLGPSSFWRGDNGAGGRTLELRTTLPGSADVTQ